MNTIDYIDKNVKIFIDNELKKIPIKDCTINFKNRSVHYQNTTYKISRIIGNKLNLLSTSSLLSNQKNSIMFNLRYLNVKSAFLKNKRYASNTI